MLSLEYKFLTICLKNYILRKFSQKNCAKPKFRLIRNFRKKHFQFCAQIAQKIAQNRAKLIAFHAQK